ncbi:MAG: trigger factor [Flavobacteriales bacterium]|nr:trigger factor [Flavobacteriales bacterium]
MQATRENKDALNAVLNVNIVADDYKASVDKILKDYRKNANVPGFRKGLVPMGMIKKQYGKAVLIDEVNKILQESVNKYIQDEKLDILGNPLPIAQDNIDWNGDEFNFQFELGLAPEFSVNLEELKGLNSYKVIVDDELVQKQVEDFASRFGNVVGLDEATEEANVAGSVVELDEDGSTVKEDGISAQATVSISDLKGKRNPNKFVGAKVGDVIILKTKSLFEEEAKLANLLGKTVEEVKDLETQVQFTISEISKVEKHEINQDLFDKIYGAGTIDSEDAFRSRIKDDAEKVYIGETDRHFLNQVTDKLLEETKVELPEEFLTKWLKSVAENPITDEQAVAEFEKSKKGIIYQLIEGKVFSENNLQITLDDVKGSAITMIKAQMAQFGQASMDDKEAEDIAMRVLQNQEEYTRISEQVKMEKLSALYKEKVSAEAKELSFDKFVAEISK